MNFLAANMPYSILLIRDTITFGDRVRSGQRVRITALC